MRRIQKTDYYYISVKGIIINCVLIVLFSVMAVLGYILPPRYITEDFANKYSARVFPKVAIVFNSISNGFMNSLTEMFAIIGAITVVVAVIVFVIKCIIIWANRGVRGLLKYSLKRIRIVATLALIGVIIFQLMIGFNYHRSPIQTKLKINRRAYTCEEYIETLTWAYTGMIKARNELGEDYNGVAHMNTNFELIVDDANMAVSDLNDIYNLDMTRTYVRAKPVMLSYFWSYTDIVGFYDAFLGEANINVDYWDIQHFPVTVCHEIAHAKGYSREYDANTIAVLACINSSRADFRYAGYYYIFSSLYGTTYQYSQHAGVDFPPYSSYPDFQKVIKDSKASALYEEGLDWKTLKDFIASFSEDVNDAYLKSNNQAGGTQTYVVPPNIYVDFYYSYVKEGSNANS